MTPQSRATVRSVQLCLGIALGLFIAVLTVTGSSQDAGSAEAADKDILVAFGVDVDAVAGWIGSNPGTRWQLAQRSPTWAPRSSKPRETTTWSKDGASDHPSVVWHSVQSRG